MKPSPAKPKKCKECKTPFIPSRPLQAVCSPVCGLTMARAKREKDEAKAKAAERKADRVKKEAMLTIPQLIKKAQIAFNRFIKERDRLAGHTCISSGRPLDWTGNATDCGHYRSVGAASHLRFNEDNAHAQSKHDNRWLSGNVAEYRIRLISRIGLDRVEALEADNQPHKWTREELIQIEADYKQKLKDLRKLETYDSL